MSLGENKIHLTQNLNFRRISIEDKNDIFIWRNDPVTILNSLSSEAVTPQKHDQWFKKVVNDKLRVYLVAFIEDVKIGLVRYDPLSDGKYEVSINLSPRYRGQGLGAKILKQSLVFIKGCVVARIKENNTNSIRAFEVAGYQFKYCESKICNYEIIV